MKIYKPTYTVGMRMKDISRTITYVVTDCDEISFGYIWIRDEAKPNQESLCLFVNDADTYFVEI